MPRRGENIRKRKDNRWEGRYIKEYDFSGKAKYASVYAYSYLDVKKKLAEAKITVTNSTSQKNAISFREVLFLWIEHKRNEVKEQTYVRYLYIIENHILPEIRKMQISQVTNDFINSFLIEKRKHGRLDGKGGLSASYIQTISFVLNSAVNYAVELNYCGPIVGNKIKIQKKKCHLEVLSLAEQTQLENYLVNNIDCRKIGILLALYTGIRLGELCGLRWDCVDFNSGTIHIMQTIERVSNTKVKNGETKTKLIISSAKTEMSDRYIPISQKTKVLLYKIRDISSPYVLPGISNSFMDPRTLQYSFKKFLKECGIRNIKFHALRHTFATRCMESGMDINTLSEILGHTSTSVTMNIYIHSTIEHKRNQIEKMSEYCGQK